MYYFDVGVGVDRHWKTTVFTYNNPDNINTGTVVKVPFGKFIKNGVVLRIVSKPSFKTKSINKVLDSSVTPNSLKFIKWYSKYYATQGGQAYSQLLPNFLGGSPGLLQENESPYKKLPPPLSAEQARATNEITMTNRPSVLHGVTGAGKTRVYITLIHEQLSKGKSSLLLYPEISLTSQIYQDLQACFPVKVFHSGLTNSQKSALWYEISNSTKPYIIIGARSTLFLPHRNLGIIIIDEAHEPSYKQDSDVRYSSIITAGGLAKAHKSKLVLGSATPPVTETEHIIKSGGNLVCIHEKAIVSKKTKTIEVIDKNVKSNFTKHYLISDQLLSSVEKSLQKDEQSLLFINRRGTAKIMLCGACTWQAECPDCDLPSTFHHDSHRLICHTCGNSVSVPTSCPECGSDIELKSLGSKAIVDEVQKIFPTANIKRFDSDNISSESFLSLYESVKSGHIDILIGTQLLVKGLDLPLLSTVGIIDADLSLHFPDFSSDERTFQIVSQASGRTGRGHTNGSTYIQTYQVNSPVIQHAKEEDWHSFREAELITRKKHRLPPFSYTAKLIFREKSQVKSLKNADKAKKNIGIIPGIKVTGPLPAFRAKRAGYFYTQLHMKSNSRAKILKVISKLPSEIIYDLDPATFL